MNATSIARELNAELRKPEPLPMTFWQINQEWVEALDKREAIAEELSQEYLPDDRRAELAEALIAADAAVDRIAETKVRKVDGVVGAIRFFEEMEATAKREADRISALAKRWGERASRVKASALAAMQHFGVTEVSTAIHRLRIQPNGGAAPLNFVEDEVPAEYKRTLIWVNTDEFEDIVEQFPDSLLVKTEVSQKKVRDAIRRGETVDGAQLGERGEHLRVE